MSNKAAASERRKTIGGLSKLTGVGIETIRYYERIGLMPEAARTPGGYRIYGPAAAQRMTFIRRARELGFGIDDIRTLLDLVDRADVTCVEVAAIAEAHLAAIRAKIDDLRRMETILAHMAAQCSQNDVPDCPIIDAFSGRHLEAG